MQVELRHQPSFSVARLHLAPGEPTRVEAGAMVATSYGVQVEAKVHGGLMKGLKRMALGGESMFVTTYTAPQQGGWVDVAANLPGDARVEVVRLLIQSRNPMALVEWLTAVLPFSRD
jgi:uncharacterized protein (AIM24 family)